MSRYYELSRERQEQIREDQARHWVNPYRCNDEAEIGWSHFQTAVDNRAESHGEGRAFGDERRDDASG